MLGSVEHLWIVSLPPFILALALYEFAVIGHARIRTFFICSVRRLEPPPVPGLMNRDPKSKPTIPRRLCPGSNDVAMWSDVLGVPLLMFRVPAIKAIVVIRESKEETGSRLLISVK